MDIGERGDPHTVSLDVDPKDRLSRSCTLSAQSYRMRSTPRSFIAPHHDPHLRCDPGLGKVLPELIGHAPSLHIRSGKRDRKVGYDCGMCTAVRAELAMIAYQRCQLDKSLPRIRSEVHNLVVELSHVRQRVLECACDPEQLDEACHGGAAELVRSQKRIHDGDMGRHTGRSAWVIASSIFVNHRSHVQRGNEKNRMISTHRRASLVRILSGRGANPTRDRLIFSTAEAELRPGADCGRPVYLLSP